MPLHEDNLNNNAYSRSDINLPIKQLDTFKRKLEKDFFSEVSVSAFSSTETQSNLLVEFQSNLSLAETIYYLSLRKSDGDHQGSLGCKDANPFSIAIAQLKDNNSLEIDIEEVCILLKDTSIIIKKIYEQSIPEQLENILEELTEHYFDLSGKKHEVPFEIYIPVFEEAPLQHSNNLLNIRSGNSAKASDFLGFWGLYFDSVDDAIIYDVANKSLVQGDLFMLNH
tara:strand:- start:68710 stop:69384 length:675 start_codon:yes stop_codon:yes gene_type:complete